MHEIPDNVMKFIVQVRDGQATDAEMLVLADKLHDTADEQPTQYINKGDEEPVAIPNPLRVQAELIRTQIELSKGTKTRSIFEKELFEEIKRGLSKLERGGNRDILYARFLPQLVGKYDEYLAERKQLKDLEYRMTYDTRSTLVRKMYFPLSLLARPQSTVAWYRGWLQYRIEHPAYLGFSSWLWTPDHLPDLKIIGKLIDGAPYGLWVREIFIPRLKPYWNGAGYSWYNLNRPHNPDSSTLDKDAEVPVGLFKLLEPEDENNPKFNDLGNGRWKSYSSAAIANQKMALAIPRWIRLHMAKSKKEGTE